MGSSVARAGDIDVTRTLGPIRITPELKRDLEALSLASGVSVAAIVKTACIEYIQRARAPDARSEVVKLLQDPEGAEKVRNMAATIGAFADAFRKKG
jgi:hypothetical protein